MWIREEILVICKRLYKSRKKFDYFYCLFTNDKIFHLLGLCLQRFIKNLCTTHPTAIAVKVRDIMALNNIFCIFLLAGVFKLMVYLHIYHWMSKQILYRTEMLFLVLIPRYGCFRVTYVPRLIELNFCPSESYR